jgi:DNA-binding NarL/FixJ family response regulator
VKSRSPKQISVVLVEDHRMFREQLGHLIGKSDDMVVSGEADNIRDGFDLIQKRRPTVAIVDVTLKGSSGLELLKQLRAEKIDVPVLVLSMHDEALFAERALNAGARGYVTKHAASEEVLTAIRRILGGEIYLNPRFMSHMARKMMTGNEVAAARLIDRLADRELEVFELIGRGLTTREIGEQLGLGTATVDTYRTRIKEKLHLENASDLRLAANRWIQERE